MLLSIVIPTHQRAQALLELLNSIQTQSLDTPYEVLVILNQEDPPLSLQLQKMAQSWIQLNFYVAGAIGVNKARNMGISKAKGDILLFLDDDCFLQDTNLLNKHICLHKENPHLDAIGGNYNLIGRQNIWSKTYHQICQNWLQTQDKTQPRLLGGHTSYKQRVFSEGFRFAPHIKFGGSETELNDRLCANGKILSYFSELCIDHNIQLSLFNYCKKAFLQGVGAQTRQQLKHLYASLRQKDSTRLLILPQKHGHKPVVQPSQKQLSLALSMFIYRQVFDMGRCYALAKSLYPQKPFLKMSACLASFLYLSWRKIRQKQRQLPSLELFSPFIASPLTRQQSWYIADLEQTHIFRRESVKTHWNPEPDEIEYHLKRAQFYQYRGFVIPYEHCSHTTIDNIIKLCKKYKLTPCLQVHVLSFSAHDWLWAKTFHDKGCAFLLLLNKSEVETSQSILHFFESCHIDYELFVLANKKIKFFPLLRALPENVLDKLSFCFSLEQWDTDNYIPPPKIQKVLHKLHKKMQKIGQPISLRGPSSIYLPDSRIQKGRDLHPLVDPEVEARACHDLSGPSDKLSHSPSQTKSIVISIIIPAYEPGEHLLKVLENLYHQSLAKELYEVIVVEDGSSKNPFRPLAPSFTQTPYQNWNLKYLYFDRKMDNGLIDTQFRAGICRNLGVQHSKGQYLCFLDSDIILPLDYLEETLRQINSNKALQSRRRMLTRESSMRIHSFCDYKPNQDTYQEDSYWEQFKKTKEWSHLSGSWKYICTYALTLPRELFFNVGGFRPSFPFYGFEDTDLAYRLYLTGAEFNFHSKDVLHLYPNRTDFEFHKDIKNRTATLQQSVRIFYHHHLAFDIYNVFGWWLGKPSIFLKLGKPYFFLRYQYQKRIKKQL